MTERKATERLSGWWAVYIPPIAKCAKDGAPVLLWLPEAGKNDSRYSSGMTDRKTQQIPPLRYGVTNKKNKGDQP
jgi:hypothetical protein